METFTQKLLKTKDFHKLIQLVNKTHKLRVATVHSPDCSSYIYKSYMTCNGEVKVKLTLKFYNKSGCKKV